MRKIWLSIFVLCFCFSSSVMAAENATTIPDTPTKIVERSTAIAVEHEGTDSIGARLNTRIKEVLNGSNLFDLTEENKPKIRILLSTISEFKDRPSIGSAYSVVWAFSQSEETLRHFLDREIGVVSPDQIDDVVAKIIAKTDTLAISYGYLFN